MTPRYTQAIQFAASAHEGQNRKGTAIPYIVHPVAVAGLVAEFGGTEDQQIAALLHDVLEDGGPHYAPQIKELFGPLVLSIVEACTDGVPDATGVKPPWEERKRAYLGHLAQGSDEMLLVSGCDKLSNAQSILSDLHKVGWAVFDRFTAKRDGTIWYYSELSGIFTKRNTPVAGLLAQTVKAMTEFPNRI
jgi:(p)ppGpp synthase/HD superfamily hydrolase